MTPRFDSRASLALRPERDLARRALHDQPIGPSNDRVESAVTGRLEHQVMTGIADHLRLGLVTSRRPELRRERHHISAGRAVCRLG